MKPTYRYSKVQCFDLTFAILIPINPLKLHLKQSDRDPKLLHAIRKKTPYYIVLSKCNYNVPTSYIFSDNATDEAGSKLSILVEFLLDQTR